jgi:hypothetical protein
MTNVHIATCELKIIVFTVQEVVSLIFEKMYAIKIDNRKKDQMKKFKSHFMK